MTEFFTEYGLFLAKAITVVVAALIIIGTTAALSMRSQEKPKEQLKIKDLNKRYQDMALALQSAILPKKVFKQQLKARKKAEKAEEKKASKAKPAAADGADGGDGGVDNATDRKAAVFVLNFDGDIRASAVSALREEISALLTVARPGDEVLLRLESPGGIVYGYGLAASQLQRIKDKQLRLTVAVDKVAASGGYMMACVADKIIAAPFAILGSIGVLAQLPNFHRLLKKNAIDFEQFTAGEFKRTVTVFGENTDKDRAKLQQDIEDTHQLFKDFVKQHRPSLDIDQVATGEIWYGTRALDVNLIDELRTSDDYLLDASHSASLYEISYKTKKPLLNRLMGAAQESLILQRSRRDITRLDEIGIDQRLL